MRRPPEWTCAFCLQPVLRNLAFFNGQPCHYGCLKNRAEFGRALWLCLGCYSYLTADKATVAIDGEARRSCPFCGSQALRRLRKR